MSTVIVPLIGGLLIGLAAAMVLLGFGRVAGISGILGGAVGAPKGDRAWRALFMVGLVGGGALLALLRPSAFATFATPVPRLIAGGLLVGFGTRLGNGCTSGHGVCGLGRVSKRSLVAVLTFMAVAAGTVFVMRHVGGAS